jgi:phosphate starvation-inducible PhoH-like protein
MSKRSPKADTTVPTPAPNVDEPVTDERRLTLRFDDTEALRILCGERDRNLRWLETRLGVQSIARGNDIHLIGDPLAVKSAAELLRSAFVRARAGGDVNDGELDRLWQAQRMDFPEPLGLQAPTGGSIRALSVARQATHPGRVMQSLLAAEGDLGDGIRPVTALTEGQKRYVEAMRRHELVIAEGPAGSGKTYLAMAAALGAMHRRDVKRIVLTRPAVEAGERLGFLPGDLNEKVTPYLRPLYDALRDLVDEDRFERLTARGQIEVAPLAFMRGRTLNNAFVILDEAQNCTVEQMLMLLTRMGEHTRIVVTGDPSQSDLPRGTPSGLAHALRTLSGVDGIAIAHLGLSDVVRHPLVGRIIAAWQVHGDPQNSDPPPRRR